MGTVPFSQKKKFKVIFVVAYGKGTVEVHGGSIVNNGPSSEEADEGGRYSCVHTSGNQHSDGAKRLTSTFSTVFGSSCLSSS